MTSNILNRKEINNQQIVIQEEPQDTSEVQECISFQEQKNNYKKVCDSDRIVKQYSNQALKINKQKLLKYQPLKQKNRQQNINMKVECKNLKSQAPILNSTFRKSNSIKFFKQIKHKVEICSKRLKTSDKQNEINHFLPKMPSKLLKDQNNKMNKTTSAINLWKQSENTANICEQFNQSKKTYVESRLNFDNQSLVDKKVSQDCFKLNSNRSQSQISRNFDKTCSFSKFSTNSEITYSHSEIVNILTKMNSDQEELIHQKIRLQQRITALREGIQKQNTFIVEINKNKQRMSTSLAKKEAGSKHSVNETKLSKKKNQNFQQLTRDLEQQLQETVQVNNKVLQNIQQEKELIRMYELVIEQVKNQLKVEKKQKLELQKKLTVMKKTQNSLYSKLCNHENNNKEIMRKIYHSLQKWQ